MDFVQCVKTATMGTTLESNAIWPGPCGANKWVLLNPKMGFGVVARISDCSSSPLGCATRVHVERSRLRRAVACDIQEGVLISSSWHGLSNGYVAMVGSPEAIKMHNLVGLVCSCKNDPYPVGPLEGSPGNSSMYGKLATNFHVRPYPLENTGSRPLSQRQTNEGRISSWVGDDQRIPGVVRFLSFFGILFFLARVRVYVISIG